MMLVVGRVSATAKVTIKNLLLFRVIRDALFQFTEKLEASIGLQIRVTHSHSLPFYKVRPSPPLH